MKLLSYTLAFFLLGIGLVLAIAYYCFRVGFYVPPRKAGPSEEIPLPEGEIYEKYWESMKRWTMQTRETPHETFFITSFDGLKLCGRFYEFQPGSPIELMFHGYRGSAERDLSGGMQRCFKLGRSAFIVDQRCSGSSEGTVITFGVNEYKDCLAWVDFVVRHFGPDTKIILTGLSMGASTVLMAGGQKLPKNVIGILADCGYHSQKEIICQVIRQMGLPAKWMYPFVRLGARIFGHFDLEEITPEEAVKRCQIPVLFFHGETDDYVPCEMSRINYEACASRKKLILIPNAGHGLCYPVGKDVYLKAAKDFFGPEGTCLPPDEAILEQ